MIIRELREGDQEAVAAIHRKMGIDYRMPELSEGDFVQVIEEDGRIVGASLNVVIAETYMWISPDLHPADKWTAIRLGQIGMESEARKRGWRELVAAIPLGVICRFAKRLHSLGWIEGRKDWQRWSLTI